MATWGEIMQQTAGGKGKREGKAAFRGDKAYLSNMYACRVEYLGVVYPSSEVAFQCAKCADDEERKALFAMSSPYEVKKAAYKVKKREDWDVIKVDIMRDIVSAKFMQNPDLADKLLATGDEILEEENNWNDKFWGTVNGEGENHLGKILMEVRSEIRQARSMEKAAPAQPKAWGVPEPKQNPAGDKASAQPQTPFGVVFKKPVPVAEIAERIKKADTGIRLKELKVEGELTDEQFADMKATILQAVKIGVPAPISKLPPAEYKYFSELYWLYVKLGKGDLSKEDGITAERKLKAAYQDERLTEKVYRTFIGEWNENIRVSEMQRSELCKAEDKDEALNIALEIISKMTGDTAMLKTVKDKLLAAPQKKEKKPHSKSAAKGNER